MKNNKLLAVIVSVFGLTVLTGACQTAVNTNSSMAANANRAMNMNTAAHSNSMSHDTANMPMNSDHNMPGMNHGEMKSDASAASAPYDLQFLDTMIHHHQGAVEMAEAALKKTSNAELTAFARKIIDDQDKEIAQMKDWREKWYAGRPRVQNMEMPGMADSMKMMMPDEMKKMETATGTGFDVLFLDMMTPHHAGAIVMAKEALTKAEHPEIKTLANQIIKAQEAEIKQMADWKAKWSK